MQTVETQRPTLTDANATIREAVKERLNATPTDDPKMSGYEKDSCCDGGKCTPIIDRFAPTNHPSSRRFIELLTEMEKLHRSKSADYGSESDPLANVRQGADFVNIEPWRGCMVRIADKMQRLRTYCRTGRLVHEGVRDTLLDLAAYSLLAIVLFDEEHDA